MALCTLADVKIPLNITGSALDTQLQFCLDSADKAIKDYLHRNIESATYTHYFDGPGHMDLLLRERPVTSITSVFIDRTGYYGQGQNAFAANTQLTSGVDYMLVKDSREGDWSDSGILRRCYGGSASQWGFAFQGTLMTGFRPISWPRGLGNIKVVYVAGYATVPTPLRTACAFYAGYLYRTGEKQGEQFLEERLAEYSYELMNSTANYKKHPELGRMRQMLARYKDVQI